MTSIGQSIQALCAEHNLDRDLIIEAMKDAVRAAARKQFKSQDKTGESIQVDWNDEEGAIEISAHKEVVVEVENPQTELSLEEAQELAGDEIEIGDTLLLPLPTEELGRIAAQTAKQILVQKVREAIREKVYEEYIDRKGEIINGSIKRFERGDMIIDLGDNLEAILPKPEQVRSENWSQGERIRVVISDVTKDPKGPQVKTSRTSSELLKRLFEQEVPEIYDDTVIIKSAVREPGDRAKIAVSSNEKDVDPVGACVGMKGSRVQSIIKELRGEKIDIIEWSDEPSVFAANALSPAKVSQVRITDINRRKMEVIVTEDQLSLAIGKRGQNVRLATRLVGWDIDIKNEAELRKEITQQMGKLMASGEAVPVSALEGVSAAQADDLKEKGITDVESLAAMSVDDLVDTLDLSLDEAERIISAAQEVVNAKENLTSVSDDEVLEETIQDSEGVSVESAEASAEEEKGFDSVADEKSDSAETEDAENQEPVSEVAEETAEEAEDKTVVAKETADSAEKMSETEVSAETQNPEMEDSTAAENEIETEVSENQTEISESEPEVSEAEEEKKEDEN